MLKYITILLLYSTPLLTIGQDLEIKERIDTLLKKEYPENEPGSTVIITKKDSILLHKAYGQANIELDVPMNKHMLFEIGSITKQFTAVAILMLMEEEKLKLNDPVSKYIENYPHGNKITIHHLLTHTSGITKSIKQNPWNETIRKKEFEPMEFIDYFKNEPMVSEPGELFRYNNFGYIILGVIIEKASGLTYEQFIETQIFHKLGMYNSYLGKDYELIKNRAYGYENIAGTFRNATFESITQAYSAGAIMSTVEDLYIWNNALHSDQIIKSSSKNLAFTNYTLNNGNKINYGYGWFIDDINGSITYEHGGGVFGFRSNAIYLPNEEVFVAIFSNCNCKNPQQISTELAAITIGKPYTEPSRTFQADEKEIQKWVGKYTFEDGSTRSVALSDKNLYWYLPNGHEIKMIATANNVFHLENSFTNVEFQLKEDTLINAVVTRRINKKIGEKPYKVFTEIELNRNVLSRYPGTYKLFPNFDLNIRLDGKQLICQGTGQKEYKIYPETETKFFYKSLDAQIEFILNDNNECTSLKITQDGKTYSGNRINQH